MPYRGTTCVLTFNLINILAESVNRSNALFWLTVWLTAKDRRPIDAIQTQRLDDLGPWTSKLGPRTTELGSGKVAGYQKLFEILPINHEKEAVPFLFLCILHIHGMLFSIIFHRLNVK